MSSKPDTITVTTRTHEEVDADAADVEVTIDGSSLFSGEEAMKKAAEVKAFTSQLMEAGIEENRIKLRNVKVDSSTFALIKSSSARYTLKIAKVSLEKIPVVLGIIGAQKNCVMNWLEWIYNNAEDVRKKLRTEALEKAIEVAKSDAATLGIEILGIHRLEEDSPNDSVNREYIGGDERLMVKRSRGSKSMDLGFALGNATNVKVILKAEFRVSEMRSSGS